jgi:hypothetical protein
MGVVNRSAGRAMMIKRGHALRYFLGLLLVLAVYGWYDYFFGLAVIDARIVSIIDDSEKPDLKYLRVEVLSDFPPYFFVSDKMRRFFRLQPKLCLITADGMELFDDGQTPCSYEEGEFEKKGKLHHMERSAFLIPFYQTHTDPNAKRDFFKSVVRDHGVWAKFQLIGFFVPPSVESKPFFLNLEPYCKMHPARCKGIFGTGDFG